MKAGSKAKMPTPMPAQDYAEPQPKKARLDAVPEPEPFQAAVMEAAKDIVPTWPLLSQEVKPPEQKQVLEDVGIPRCSWFYAEAMHIKCILGDDAHDDQLL